MGCPNFRAQLQAALDEASVVWCAGASAAELEAVRGWSAAKRARVLRRLRDGGWRGSAPERLLAELAAA